MRANKKIILPFLLISLFVFHKTFSQNYSEGYLLNLQGDTLAGFIKERSNLKNTEEFLFKETLESVEKSFTPNLVTEAVVKNRKFISVLINEEPFKKKVFIEALVSGVVSLYQASDQKRENYFILKNKKEEFVVLKKNNYYGMLKYHLTGCSSIDFDNLNTSLNTTYSENDLAKLLFKYNNCINPEEKSVYKKKKIRIKKGILLGISQNTLTISDEELYSDSYGSFATFSPGIYLDLYLNNNLSIYTSINFFKYKGGLIIHETPPSFARHTMKLEYTDNRVRIPFQLKYSFNGKVRPYLNLGPQVDWMLNQEVIHYYNNDYPPEKKPINFRKISLGFTGGAGIAFSPFDNKMELKLEARYNYSALSYKSFVAADMQAYEVFLGLGF